MSVVSSVAYRCGGSGNYGRWVRPVGLMLSQTMVLVLLGYIHWTLILCAGAIYGLSTSYYKRKGSDATAINWALVGLAFSISVIPIVLVYHNWLGFGIRTLACTVLVTAWSQWHGNAVWEECGRGAIPIVTLPLLLLG